MKRSSIVAIALVALVGSAVGLYAAESETFTGTAAASGTYKRPQLLVDGKRFELKASDPEPPPSELLGAPAHSTLGLGPPKLVDCPAESGSG